MVSTAVSPALRITAAEQLPTPKDTPRLAHLGRGSAAFRRTLHRRRDPQTLATWHSDGAIAALPNTPLARPV